MQAWLQPPRRPAGSPRAASATAPPSASATVPPATPAPARQHKRIQLRSRHKPVLESGRKSPTQDISCCGVRLSARSLRAGPERSMATHSMNRILGDLNLDFNDLAAAHGFSVIGLERLPAYVATLPEHSRAQDPVIFVINQVKRNWPVETRLGHLWIVTLYALWEEKYRPRFAAAHGRSPADEKYDLWGDLRHLRNDVVHHGGIATAENTGRCVLLYHWFQPGDVIRLKSRHFDELLRLIPWKDMALGTNTRSVW